MKRLRSTSAGRWWLVWVSGGREWVLGSSKAVNAACLAVFDPSTNSALSRQPESVKKCHMALYGPPRLMYDIQTTNIYLHSQFPARSQTRSFLSRNLSRGHGWGDGEARFRSASAMRRAYEAVMLFCTVVYCPYRDSPHKWERGEENRMMVPS